MVKRDLYKSKDANILGSRESSQLFNSVKMQTKSKNYESCKDAMISYVEVVVNCLKGFTQFIICRRIFGEV
jgi:hypothetical protein